MSLADIVNVQITATTATPTRAGFGTPLIAAYHTRWTDRVRSYTGLAGMAADGIDATEPAYKKAAAIFAQNPRVTRVKVGRRVGQPAQVVTLVPAAPALGTVYSINVEWQAAAYTASGTDNLAAVCTAVASAINALAGNVASATAIIASGVTSTTGIQTLTGSSFNGATGAAPFSPSRLLEFVFSSHADWDATTITVTGKNSGGQTITDTIAVPNGGNSTVKTTKRFAQVTQIVIPAQSGTGGTLTVGFPLRVTADGSSATHVTCTTAALGELLAYDSWWGPVASVPSMTLTDSTALPGTSLQTDLAAIAAADNDWYGLVLDSDGKAEAEDAAVWAEANGKIMVVQTADDAAYDSSSTTDLAAALKTSGYARTACEYAGPYVQANPIAAGMLGNRLPADPGSDTWAFKQLAGIKSYALTDTQVANLHAKNCGTYVVVAGVAITQDGKSASGEFVDIVRFVDWLQARIQERVFALLVQSPKLAYTDASADIIKAEILAQLKQGVQVGGLNGDFPLLVSAPKVADVDVVDRGNRHFPDIEFSARLAGAIQSMDITGTVSV